MVTANEEGALTATAGRHRISPDTVRLAETESDELVVFVVRDCSPLPRIHQHYKAFLAIIGR